MGKTEAVRLGLIARQVADSLIAVLLAPPCAACGEPLTAPTAGIVCGACWLSARTPAPPFFLPDLDACHAAGVYTGALREIVHAFKYGRRTSLARPLAALALERCGDALAGADAVVPVPLHRSRERERGFNQAALIARAIPLPCLDSLVRLRATPPQTGLPANARRTNLRGAFALNGMPIPRALVLLDDVATTGATLGECARVLRSAGAREVRALAIARTI